MKKTIKFGILGCGMIANIHIAAINQIEEAELFGVADNNESSARSFAEKYSVKAYKNYAEMLDDENIEAVCICTPSCFHASGAIEALEHSKHVVLEKPMALSTSEADEVIKACEKSGKMLTVISQLRFSDDIIKAKELVAQNAFGKITLCNLFMKYYRTTEYYSSSPWKGTLKFDGGGALMNQGIHGVDILEYIVGGIKTVKGQIKTLSHDIEVEDTAVAMLEFDNGALGLIEASTCAYPGFERKIEIHGDRGYVILNENKIEKIMINGEECSVAAIESKEKSTANDPSSVQSEGHRLQIQNLISAIYGREKLLIDGNEGRKAIRVIEEIYKG